MGQRHECLIGKTHLQLGLFGLDRIAVGLFGGAGAGLVGFLLLAAGLGSSGQ